MGMGSLMEPAEGAMDDSVVPKTEPDREASSSSVGSTPEAEADLEAVAEPEAFIQDVAQTQKRKGGRKPIYATSEERKQRNRQAQAAFRERRTEYIKQLETTIKHHEDTLQNLQQSHRTAADECLMLRYKNSLLERILLEKGIDVQAELRAKGGPHLSPAKPAMPQTSQASPIQRAMINRQQARRPAGIAPKLDPVNPMAQPNREGAFATQSPQLQPTPSSHNSSPSTSRSPGFAVQGGISPSTSDFQAQQPHTQQRPQPQQQLRSLNASHPAISGVTPTSISSATIPPAMVPMTAALAGGLPAVYYPSQFQKHIDQLEQEYDAQADMADDQDPADSADQSPFITDFNQAPMQNQIGFQQPQSLPPHSDAGSQSFGQSNQLFDPFDPMLDADPFGLTASMHFPTQFNYEPGSSR